VARRSEDDLFAQLSAVYQSFREAAELENTQDGPKRVFRGHVGRIFEHHGLRGSSYSRVRDVLIQLECIEPLHRGTTNQKSVFIVHGPPTREGWDELRAGGHATLRSVTRAKVGLEIGQLAARVQRLESAFAAHIREEMKKEVS
jgi:hypothetical protein